MRGRSGLTLYMLTRRSQRSFSDLVSAGALGESRGRGTFAM
jgi:hypothetical protein